MADIFQCNRCGAITYRGGIRLHDEDHKRRDEEMKTLQDSVEQAEKLELHNWPTPAPESADVQADDLPVPYTGDDPFMGR